jgi:hypothetical protein
MTSVWGSDLVTCVEQIAMSLQKLVFFLEHIGELRIISLIEEKMYKGTSKLVDYKSPFKSTKI